MYKKIIILSGFTVFAIVAVLNTNENIQEKNKNSFALNNIEALANNENNGGGQKVCYFKGTTKYSDYYTCEGSYPNVTSCGNTNRQNEWFSIDKHVCDM